MKKKSEEIILKMLKYTYILKITGTDYSAI